MFEFQNLEVYKKSVQFHLNCKMILGKIKLEKYVNDQLGRASYSIVLNIAEGCAKSSKADRKNYFTTARGSVFKCVAILDIMHQSEDLEENKYLEIVTLADVLS
jgi:four helix bundle protein